jgi:diguanylate cyclase (GGDEF)-like protein
VLLGLLYLVSLYNYLLFHSLAELFSISVAAAVFMLVWNTRRFMTNDFFLYIGTSYLFIGFLDLLHTLSYRGMGVFGGDDANLPTQLWIAARYLQSVSLLISPIFLTRRVNPGWTFLGFSVIVAAVIVSIATGIFPDCYVDGLTPFKKVSEYMISVIFAGAAILLMSRREAFDQRVLALVEGSILFTMLAELSFTLYVSIYGLSNFLGHVFKIIATYLIYKSIIETGLNRPLDLLFRDLKKREEELSASQEQLRQIATHDALTGLPNRLLFWDRLTHTLEAACRKNYPPGKSMVGVMVMDVDNFKDINDTQGHAAGDEVLMEIARRLKAQVRGSDTVSRLGGDEFAIVLGDIEEQQDAECVAHRACDSRTDVYPGENHGGDHQPRDQPVSASRHAGGNPAALRGCGHVRRQTEAEQLSGL